MKMWRRASTLALPLVVVLLAAACGGASSANDTATSDEAAVSAQATATEAPAEEEASDEPKSLDEYLGLAANAVRGRQGGGGGGAAGADQDQVLEQQRLVQQGIQVCMLEQGFTYVPEEVGDGLRFFLQSDNTGQSASEYAETQGFGISTRFDAVLEGDFEVDDAVEPNEEHLATLSEGERDAWQFALRGAPPERNAEGQLIDPETGEVIQGGPGRVTGGCTAEAQEEVRGDLSLLAELTDEFIELDERIAADPRLTELQREWIDCMRGEGFDYQDEPEARAELNQDFRPLLRSFFQGGADGAQGGGGRGNPLEAVAGLELSAEQEVELEALQDKERAIAVASLECQGDSEAEIAEITERYEAEFVEVNREILESFS